MQWLWLILCRRDADLHHAVVSTEQYRDFVDATEVKFFSSLVWLDITQSIFSPEHAQVFGGISWLLPYHLSRYPSHVYGLLLIVLRHPAMHNAVPEGHN